MASGPMASGPTASGPTGSGSTASGSTASGPTAPGPTASGSTGSGSTGPGSTELWFNGLWSNGLWANGLSPERRASGSGVSRRLAAVEQVLASAAAVHLRVRDAGRARSDHQHGDHPTTYNTTLDPNGTLLCAPPGVGGEDAGADGGPACDDGTCALPQGHVRHSAQRRHRPGHQRRRDGVVGRNRGRRDVTPGLETASRSRRSAGRRHVRRVVPALGVGVRARAHQRVRGARRDLDACAGQRAAGDQECARDEPSATADDARHRLRAPRGRVLRQHLRDDARAAPPPPTPDGYSGPATGPIAETPIFYACAGPDSNIPEITKRFCSSQGDQVVINVPGVCLANRRRRRARARGRTPSRRARRTARSRTATRVPSATTDAASQPTNRPLRRGHHRLPGAAHRRVRQRGVRAPSRDSDLLPERLPSGDVGQDFRNYSNGGSSRPLFEPQIGNRGPSTSSNVGHRARPHGQHRRGGRNEPRGCVAGRGRACGKPRIGSSRQVRLRRHLPLGPPVRWIRSRARPAGSFSCSTG